jgi:hypothetical protein
MRWLKVLKSIEPPVLIYNLCMLKDLSITFSEPICLCKAQAVKWNIEPDKDDFELHIWCTVCGVEVIIPSAQLRASIVFERPYESILEENAEVIRIDFRGTKKPI